MSWKQQLQEQHFPKWSDGSGWCYIDINHEEVGEFYEDIVQFISDLRKRDEEELIKIVRGYIVLPVDKKEFIVKSIENYYKD